MCIYTYIVPGAYEPLKGQQAAHMLLVVLIDEVTQIKGYQIAKPAGRTSRTRTLGTVYALQLTC